MSRFSTLFLTVVFTLVYVQMQCSHGSATTPVGKNQYMFTMLSPDTVSNMSYGMSPFGLTGVSNSVTCARRVMESCRQSSGFRYDSVTGDCIPVLWLHRGYGGIVVTAGTEEDYPVSVYFSRQINGSCPHMFEFVPYGSEGRSSCLLEITSLQPYQNATAECNSFGGYLASVRTADKYQLIKTYAKGQYMWIGLDDIEEEGVHVWQEDGSLFTSADDRAVGDKIFSLRKYSIKGDCVRYQEFGHQDTYHINDMACTLKHKALCEIQPLPVAC
ncbi:C-type lectin [Plakobranchus ocellatus]|uniref:C-type lectin n=1 Tax=Plakobranchus ocellatus TaxID=259542 RepID=A0AAV3YQG2_9GAST|nr:C-type lectin [Plakobranchus ocellatus]